ncbi:MAG: hypothetical protein ACJAUP_002621 [Cellvibrionaceae bacterium]|jgi:hypothetical protein
MLSVIEPSDYGNWPTICKIENKNPNYKYCSNIEHEVCCWLRPKASEFEHYTACQINRYIPNMKPIKHKQQWRQLEFAKHRLVYSLLRFKLAFKGKK